MPTETSASASGAPVRVAMVCLGNICRSPLAEALLRKHLASLGAEDRVDVRSYGTSNWHEGGPADPRTSAEAASRGVDLSRHRSSHFTHAVLAAADHVFVMDKRNLHDVLALDLGDEHSHKVRLVREFDPEPGDFAVPDPYAGGPEGFAHVHDLLDRTTRRLAEEIVRQHGLPHVHREA